MTLATLQLGLANGVTPELIDSLNSMLPVELADFVQSLSYEERQQVFSLLEPELAADAFAQLPIPVQKELVNILPSTYSAALLNALDPDDRVAFFEELPSTVVNALIKLLSPEERSSTLKLLGFPEYSVGRLMTPDYIAVKADWSIERVLAYVRKYGHHSETIDYLYVVDDAGKLVDDIKLIEFLFAPPDDKVFDLVDRKFIALAATDDQSTAVTIFRKHDRLALPVIDKQGILLGIVTMDDILHVIEEENTEDLQRFGGMEALEGPYLQTPFFELMKKRGGWLTILFLGEMFTATAMGYFQDEIAKAVVLTMFLPLIISSGGNSGSQASTLIIRAMALDEVRMRDWWRILKREVCSGVFLGLLLGSIAFFRIALWSAFTPLYGPHWILVGLTVSLALLGVVLWGSLTGSMLPILLKKLGADPAVSSAPFVATLIDVTGIVIYFVIAIFVLQGSLL